MLCLKKQLRTVLLLGLLIVANSYLYDFTPSLAQARSHVVTHGDTLSAIATQYGLSIQQIANANNIHNINQIRVGQILQIPTISTTSFGNQPVRGNESFSQINPSIDIHSNIPAGPIEQNTQPMGHPDATLYEPSHYPIETQPAFGSPVSGPSSSDRFDRPASTYHRSCDLSPDDGERLHIVRPGDTLYAIASNHGVTVTAIRRRNALTSDRIRVGECLLVPEGQRVSPVPDRRRSSERPHITPTPSNSPQPTSEVRRTVQSRR